jgi:Holliday junction resolvasome RuvABC DNA-binding subunit
MSRNPEPLGDSLNQVLASRLDEIGRLLEEQEANPFRTQAYRRAAALLRGLPEQVDAILQREGLAGLDRLPGIGPALARMIAEYVSSGHLRLLDQLRGAHDPIALLRSVPAVGPKLARRLHDELGIDSLEELEYAAHDGRLAKFEGIGPKRLTAIRESLASRLARRRPSERWSAERPPVEDLLEVDRQYRSGAAGGTLRKITPKRFNPHRQAWLPILHVRKGDWDYTALYSNTPRAHELGKTRDWVVIYYENDGAAGQCTVVTPGFGPHKGRRVVRGREAECG